MVGNWDQGEFLGILSILIFPSAMPRSSNGFDQVGVGGKMTLMKGWACEQTDIF